MKNSNFVMPAWIAGIQIRKDASGNIHVNLYYSAPCWNDGIDGPLLEVTEAPLFPYFQRRARRARRFVIVVYESFAVDFFSDSILLKHSSIRARLRISTETLLESSKTVNYMAAI